MVPITDLYPIPSSPKLDTYLSQHPKPEMVCRSLSTSRQKFQSRIKSSMWKVYPIIQPPIITYVERFIQSASLSSLVESIKWDGYSVDQLINHVFSPIEQHIILLQRFLLVNFFIHELKSIFSNMSVEELQLINNHNWSCHMIMHYSQCLLEIRLGP